MESAIGCDARKIRAEIPKRSGKGVNRRGISASVRVDLFYARGRLDWRMGVFTALAVPTHYILAHGVVKQLFPEVSVIFHLHPVIDE